jgi:RNA polymerase sigma-70 factor (sigma-E family)
VDSPVLNSAEGQSSRLPASGENRADPAGDPGGDVAQSVTALYQAHAVSFVRLAVVMLGDRAAAEDVVQEAFCGLYRRWRHLHEPAKALQYVRTSVFNGCRSQLRARSRAERRDLEHPARHSASAEEHALVEEEHQQVLAALRGLPARQREVLVLRYYLDLSEADTAAAMGISQGTVKSTTSRALATLGRKVQGASS